MGNMCVYMKTIRGSTCLFQKMKKQKKDCEESGRRYQKDLFQSSDSIVQRYYKHQIYQDLFKWKDTYDRV